MPSLINRITNFSRTPQSRGLMAQVQERLTGGGKAKSRGRSRAAGRRAAGRRAAGRSARGRRR
jgi:hypothetical protein